MGDQRIVVLIGLPGSGKSTWARVHGGTVLSSDDLRRLLRDDVTDQTIHGPVFGLMRRLLRMRLELGARLTIIDATNVNHKQRRAWLKTAELYGCLCEAVFFDTPVEECLARNAARGRVVPAEAILQMARRLQPPSAEEGFDAITVVSSKDGAQIAMRSPGPASPSR